jgi:hypothetical protein
MKVTFDMDDSLYATAMDIISDMGYDDMESYIGSLVRNDLDMYGIYGVPFQLRVPNDAVLV